MIWQSIISVKTVLAIALVWVSVSPLDAQVVGGGPYGGGGGPMPGGTGELRGVNQLTGTVICTDCTVEEVRATQPQLFNLYRFDHRLGELVFNIDTFGEYSQYAWWTAIAGLGNRVSVRAPDEVFQELAAEENRFKQIAISGILRKNGTFDLNTVDVVR